MLMPPVDRYMTRQPWTIGRDAPMSEAQQLMRQHNIRHLPVLDGGKLVGLVCDRDLRFIETLPCSDPDEVAVGEVMVVDVFTARTDEPMDCVVETMASRKYGSVVVIDRSGEV